MLNIFLPQSYDASACRDDVIVSRDTFKVKALLDNNDPVVFPASVKVSAYGRVHDTGGLMVTMNKAQTLPRKGGSSIIFKWYFGVMKRTRAWSGDIKVVIPTAFQQDAPPKLVRYRASKSAASVDPHQLEADLCQIEHAIKLLSNQGVMEGAGFDAKSSPLSRRAGAYTLLRDAVAASIEEHHAKDRAKALENDAARDLMSALPDGTPLILRSGERGTWQLALKKGRLTASMARHTMIAPSDILRGEDLRAAGLSAHDVLPLDMTAAKARATHPEACRFQADPPELVTTSRIHPGQPFHKSFLTGRRAREAAAWMGTQSHSGYHGRFGIISSSVRWRKGRYGPDYGNPPMIRADAHTVILKESTRYRDAAPTLPRFGQVGHLWCLEPDVVEIMKDHNIGDASFAPVRLLDINGKALKDDYQYMAVDTPVRAVIETLCDKDAITFSGGRTIQPFEITIDQSKVEGLDFWWDDTVRGGTFFFSDRLYKALRKVKGMPHIAPKACAGV